MKDGYAKTPLHSYATKGNFPLLQKHLKSNSTPLGVQDSHGITPLIAAIKTGHVEEAKLLLGYGAEVDHKDFKGRTALSYAAENGDMKAIAALLNNHAEINRADILGKTPLMYASGYHITKPKIYKDAVKLLIEKGASTIAQDMNGMTALVYAAANSHFDILKILLERPVEEKKYGLEAIIDKLCCCFSGSTTQKDLALISAVMQDNTEIIYRLLFSGAKVNKIGKTLHGTPVKSALERSKNILNEDIQVALSAWKKGKYDIAYKLLIPSKDLEAEVVGAPKVMPDVSKEYLNPLMGEVKAGASGEVASEVI